MDRMLAFLWTRTVSKLRLFCGEIRVVNSGSNEEITRRIYAKLGYTETPLPSFPVEKEKDSANLGCEGWFTRNICMTYCRKALGLQSTGRNGSSSSRVPFCMKELVRLFYKLVNTEDVIGSLLSLGLEMTRI